MSKGLLRRLMKSFGSTERCPAGRSRDAQAGQSWPGVLYYVLHRMGEVSMTNEKCPLRDWHAEKSWNSQVGFWKLGTNAFGARSVFVCVVGAGPSEPCRR